MNYTNVDATVSVSFTDEAGNVIQAPGPTIAVPAYPGWSASLDGNAVPVIRANHALMAVLVPAGEHHLTLDYKTSFVPGLLLSLVGLIASIALSLRRTTPPRLNTPGR